MVRMAVDTPKSQFFIPVAVITFILVVLLLYSELTYFFWPGLKFRFAPDADLHAKLKLNVDMTVAMPCDCESQILEAASSLILCSDWGGYPGQDKHECLHLWKAERGADLVATGTCAKSLL